MVSPVFSQKTTVSASNSPTSTRMLLNSAEHGTPDAEEHGQLSSVFLSTIQTSAGAS